MPEIVPAEQHTPKEALARTAHCPVCNSPPNISCQYIFWVKTADVVNCGRVTIPGSWRVSLKPRKYHSKRLENAEYTAEQKAKHG